MKNKTIVTIIAFDAAGWDIYCEDCNYEVLDEEMNGVIALSIYGDNC